MCFDSGANTPIGTIRVNIFPLRGRLDEGLLTSSLQTDEICSKWRDGNDIAWLIK